MGINVSIVGISGAVGQKMLEVLEASSLEVDDLHLYASKNSAGKKFSFRGKRFTVKEFDENIHDDIVFFVVSAKFAAEFAKKIKNKVGKIIDNSKAHRKIDEIPLVVPSINGKVIKKKDKIIANPNCSTIEMLLFLHPIYKHFGIEKIIVTTLQAVSGSGLKAINSLYEETKDFIEGKEVENRFYPHPIAFNIIPFIGNILDNHYSEEEDKMLNETQKIFNDKNIKVFATTLRVPTFYSHFESIFVKTKKEVDLKKLYNLFKKDPLLRVLNDEKNYTFPMPISSANTDIVDVGRLKYGANKKEVLGVISADNLRIGAATNAVRIAEYVVKNDLV
ncbi:MAG: aspartate-semialdehyde dehydrogenase [Armatimonadetes bacterium]|nr:aspartate-semialdehyde dehydrogenase [Armatimonadota bacterium]